MSVGNTPSVQPVAHSEGQRLLREMAVWDEVHLFGDSFLPPGEHLHGHRCRAVNLIALWWNHRVIRPLPPQIRRESFWPPSAGDQLHSASWMKEWRLERAEFSLFTASSAGRVVQTCVTKQACDVSGTGCWVLSCQVPHVVKKCSCQEISCTCGSCMDERMLPERHRRLTDVIVETLVTFQRRKHGETFRIVLQSCCYS